MIEKFLLITGTRGLPARHGGFETFAEKLALFLVAKGWRVTVYCQNEEASRYSENIWHGIHLLQVPTPTKGALGSIFFDWRVVRHAAAVSSPGLVLTLGYNTAIFSGWYRLRGVRNIINMDGLEWKRQKWGIVAKAWLFGNERLGCWLGHHLVADHPEIAAHLAKRVALSKITMIPYGAENINADNVDGGVITDLGLRQKQYALVIARPEPENSILEIVTAFSRKKRGCRLVILGDLDPDHNSYHKKILAAADKEVLFPGAIYDKKMVRALRFFSRLYIHGHQVGGTNPSLVESLGAGTPVLAHDNRFNRWVAGAGACFFSGEEDCARKFSFLLDNEAELKRLGELSRKRWQQQFTWDRVLSAYEDLLLSWLP